MDVALKNGMRLNAEQAKQEIISLIDEVKKVEGEFVSVWHNESLSDYKEWQGWRDVYGTQIEYINKTK